MQEQIEFDKKLVQELIHLNSLIDHAETEEDKNFLKYAKVFYDKYHYVGISMDCMIDLLSREIHAMGVWYGLGMLPFKYYQQGIETLNFLKEIARDCNRYGE